MIWDPRWGPMGILRRAGLGRRRIAGGWIGWRNQMNAVLSHLDHLGVIEARAKK